MGPNVAILPVITITVKDLPVFPRFTPYDFLSRCKFNTLSTLQPMVEILLTHVLMFSATDAGTKSLTRIELMASALL